MKKKTQTRTIIPPWEKKTAFTLEILILLSGIYQTFFGDIQMGILILLSFAIITIPRFFTRDIIDHFPIEVEILLFLMVLLQFILGEVRHFYTNVPYYDKVVHYLLPMFLGIIGFLIFYSMYITGKLQTSIGAMFFIIIFITLGIGAMWEIMEYLSDVLLYPTIPGWHHFQGNAQQDALTDTMTDLIYDTLGAIFGSLLGFWFLRKKTKKNPRGQELIAEVDEILYNNPRQSKK